MDEAGKKLVMMLLSNSKSSLAELGRELRMSETAVRKRILKLEAEGVITGYTAIVDPHAAGFKGAALVGVDAEPERLFFVLGALRKMHETRYAALTSGDHMIMIEVWCDGEKELEKLLHRVEKIKGVTRVCPAILLKKIEQR